MPRAISALCLDGRRARMPRVAAARERGCRARSVRSSVKTAYPPPTCFGLYGIFLATMEAKLEGLKSDYPLVSRNGELTYPYLASARLQHLAKTVTVAPAPLVKVINAVGIIKRDGFVYLPAVRANLRDINNEFVPRPETVLYSNLRETVVALANPHTPERTRTYFEQHNPIPGAIFENHVLQNPDEIMPDDYGLEELQREIRVIQPFLIKLQKHVPKLVSGVLDFKSTGKPSLFISNEMENLRIPNRARNQDIQDWYRNSPGGEGGTRGVKYFVQTSAAAVAALAYIESDENTHVRPVWANFVASPPRRHSAPVTLVWHLFILPSHSDSISGNTMSRRDKILSLAISQNQNSKPHVSPSEPTSHQLIPRPSIIKTSAVQKVKSFETTVTRHSLKCYETLPYSEEECEKMNRPVNYFEDSDDSVIDKDYIPDFIISDSDSDSPICIKRNLLEHKKTRGKKTEREETEHDETEPEETEHDETEREETEHNETEHEKAEREEAEYDETEREETERKETEHEETERKETEREETGYEETEHEEIKREETEHEHTQHKHNTHIHTEREEIRREETERENSEVEECVILENEKGLTKAGMPRKRRRFDTSLADRQRQKKENADEKLSLKPPCDGKCRKKCTTKISEEIRREIHDRYIRLDWESRGLFIKGMVESKEIKTRTTKEGRNKRRDVSYYYHFQVKHEKIDVCKTFFLTTLGYTHKITDIFTRHSVRKLIIKKINEDHTNAKMS
ncbi:unnamed protein product, partial [Brenthis ino]